MNAEAIRSRQTLVDLMMRLGLDEHVSAVADLSAEDCTRWSRRCCALYRERLLNMPAGRYAVETENGLRFFRVDKPTEGRWAGYTFVKVQASDDFYPVRGQQEREAVLALIAWNPKEAMLRYGREIGSCGHCGRTLTNEESRRLGIGPVCRKGMGWS